MSIEKNYVVCLKPGSDHSEVSKRFTELGIDKFTYRGTLLGDHFFQVKMSPAQVELVKREPWTKHCWFDAPLIPA